MALPFIAGIAAGALAVVAWNRKDELKDKTYNGIAKGKKAICDTIEKGKQTFEKKEEKEAVKKTTPRKKAQPKTQKVEK